MKYGFLVQKLLPNSTTKVYSHLNVSFHLPVGPEGVVIDVGAVTKHGAVVGERQL